jgi:hypothetical protein
MSRAPLVLALVLGALLGCGKKRAEDKVINVADDDPKMNAARNQARATVSTFI